MKLNSKLFDNIRIKARGDKPVVEAPKCDWDGCEKPGTHRAPKSHRAGGEFHNFCLEHVRQYNKSFNYFAEGEEGKAKKAAYTADNGERPTWGMGANAHGRGNPKPRANAARDSAARRINDPHNLFARLARNQGRSPVKAREKRIAEADKRALEVLGLEGRKTSDEIKSAYKALVKMYHPDANGGDRSSEARLHAIITAYTHLKQKGFVV